MVSDVISLDFGGSTVDFCSSSGLFSFENEGLDFDDLESFLIKSEIQLNRVSTIVVTGGKSKKFDDTVFDIDVVKVGEIDAIGKGGRHLSGFAEDLIVTSMGTGTCIVKASGDHFEHIGGTGVGGGTLLSLASEMLNIDTLSELFELYKSGDHNKVDTLVKDIVGEGIGRVPDFWTASNLGNMRDADYSKDDLAAGVVYLVGQTIGLLSSFAANRFSIKNVCLIGKLSRFESLMTIFNVIGEVYGVKFFIPENAAYGTCIGAYHYYIDLQR